MAHTIEVDDHITVGALAELVSLPAAKLIGELFKNGILATINEKIDFDTAQIIVGELELDIELQRKKVDVSVGTRQKPVASDKAKPRPPVIAVMGHVDHGKTSLLDAIRGAQVVKGEAGGITQHISAYQIEHNDRLMTFLDTPGHEAFAALREHGALLTDVAVIVVAADDGIKPQTLEAIRFARKAGVKMIIAANKVDKAEADINRLKQQLAENELIPDDWGGDTIILPVSAKAGTGIPELLDMILLVADVEDLRADQEVPASGLIIEAHMEKGRGPVAVALVEQGVLKPGTFVVSGSVYAKVRNLESTAGVAIKDAPPSTPVVMTGFKALPEFGDEFVAVANEKEARNLSQQQTASTGGGKLDMSGNELIRIIDRTNQLQALNIIVKADVQGSVTSVIDSLKSLDTEEVSVRVVGSGVGAISENDVRMAASSQAIIYGFHVDVSTAIKRQASRDKVSIRSYEVIYELIDDVRAGLELLLSPEIIETDTGRLLVKGVFNTTKTEIICGGEVTKGKLVVPAFVRIYREDELLAEVEATGLKHGPTDTKEVLKGEMCGVSLATTAKIELQEGDRLEFFTRETKQRTL